ncbi:Phosphatidate phosphatase APP1 [Balamuthia mandrillaris]
MAVGLPRLYNWWESTSIRADESITLFPTLSTIATAAAAAPKGTVATANQRLSLNLHIHGSVFEEEKESKTRGFVADLMLSLVEAVVGRPSNTTTIPETSLASLFRERVWHFLVDNESGKRVTVRLRWANGTTTAHPLTAVSRSNGHFEEWLRFEEDDANQSMLTDLLRFEEEGGWKVRYSVEADDGRVFEGRSHVLEANGISVITDIDDTCRITGVLNGSRMLSSTFLLPFEEVRGIARMFQQWKDGLMVSTNPPYSLSFRPEEQPQRQKEAEEEKKPFSFKETKQESRDVAFHYLSGSPYQFFRPLHDFLKEEGFPEGSWHLNEMDRDWTSFFRFFSAPIQHKLHHIDAIMHSYPLRRYILVGDDGQSDPEIYAEVAGRYPEQVVHVFIHHVNQSSADAVTSTSLSEDAVQRCVATFSAAGVPSHKWTLFPSTDIPTLTDRLLSSV